MFSARLMPFFNPRSRSHHHHHRFFSSSTRLDSCLTGPPHKNMVFAICCDGTDSAPRGDERKTRWRGRVRVRSCRITMVVVTAAAAFGIRNARPARECRPEHGEEEVRVCDRLVSHDGLLLPCKVHINTKNRLLSVQLRCTASSSQTERRDEGRNVFCFFFPTGFATSL